MTPEQARELLAAVRPKGRPDHELAAKLKQAKAIIQKSKKSSAPKNAKTNTAMGQDYTKMGNRGFSRHLFKMSTEELKRYSGLNYRSSKELLATKAGGRPSADAVAKRMVAHELLQRANPSSNRPVRLLDRFKQRRRRGGGRARKKKTLPAPSVDPGDFVPSEFNHGTLSES